ncbi:MAG: NAD(+) diphosphatase [Deltaproteobacteria bacterium]|nr:NAD(+) diphosphatase [Deltaproteobacteria bacterium]
MVFSEDGSLSIPRHNDLEALNIKKDHVQYMGTYNGVCCYAAWIEPVSDLPACFSIHPPLSLLESLGSDMVRLSGLAGQLITWSRNHRFCGKCGSITEDKDDERAKICVSCGQIYYPRLSPAIIVAITRDDRLLLASSPSFRSRFYSVLAGYVEPGDTLEACVKREVREEVGIEVKNIRYFGSQPWPFPDSLMIGFTAEHESGEIRPDIKEITDARWFKRDESPNNPPGISIARRLIDWFIRGKETI